MGFPDFFEQAPVITLNDPLASFLGASSTGTITYSYTDAVKLAGHSCPTVAGAYLMVRKGLDHLHGDEVPSRGNIEIHMRDPRDQGTTGVIASIATLITGAAPETGFGGIGVDPRLTRRNLLRFDAPIEGIMAMRRRDNGRGVVLNLNAAVVPPHPEIRACFSKAVSGEANEAELQRFGELWQDRVSRMLIENVDNPDLVQLSEWNA